MKYHSAVVMPAKASSVIFTYQVGQWFKRPDGTLTQYVGTRTTPLGNIVPHFCDVTIGETFQQRTQRFARARWHLAYRHGDVLTLIKRAPYSVDDATLGRLVRAKVA